MAQQELVSDIFLMLLRNSGQAGLTLTDSVNALCYSYEKRDT
jgi:hypothetical protein